MRVSWEVNRQATQFFHVRGPAASAEGDRIENQCRPTGSCGEDFTIMGNSVDQLRPTRSVAYSVELVLLNNHQISGGGADLHCYPHFFFFH